jgi:competence protein ComEA
MKMIGTRNQKMLAERLNKQPYLILIVGILAGLIGVIATALIVMDRNQSDVVIIYGEGAGEVTIEIRGAVVQPGVQTLPSGSRVGDAIDAAGGLTEDADLALVNRARRLDDGELVIIPVAVPQASPIDLAQATADSGEDVVQGISYKININNATQAELESLPGIGPVIAARIIEYRTLHGPFTESGQLLEVEGISENLLAEIQSLITIVP